MTVRGTLALDRLDAGQTYRFRRVDVPIRELDDAELMAPEPRPASFRSASPEMKTHPAPFRRARPRPDRLRARNAGPDLERALLAQDACAAASRSEGARSTTCSSKRSSRRPHDLGCDWLVSVFCDNAGVVRFDDEHDVCFKVETHNHPSAIDPYGGANTGLGGVIRDALGTGLGAKPICNTDVFCVAPPDLPSDAAPAGHAPSQARAQGRGRRRARLRQSHGNPHREWRPGRRPGLPGQSACFLRNGGRLPRGKSEKMVVPGDRIVAIGGRTGRDGIHGATFSSTELTAQSEALPAARSKSATPSPKR